MVHGIVQVLLVLVLKSIRSKRDRSACAGR